ncbi:MAG: YebC/PmpR family DNA-binding transcriptional regulator [Candidatus Komeilibacteria bacterium CG_4_10_14_0_2_um_filter_37_10]|uniref:Probable transcriptional regulatory protein COX77_04290 n=1 Tax=Candidatus Komeilibacteria bacterium CG_4_10_14_0_2_um_filter_37_10 TaxID=1974470 RepID=A0A2M7VDZ5_9BACT|nr:MAG: YebC/PmpR family DNA-binding transcriptional regulator [Candidatus Komeilibacteria bacterium CG_4_10_14_0_2_um_filter_37_10]PJA92454.1 MAG: YebC/PmpR family DNA-binding transcriptional regulator [Candidatus Komeilibacteria bacterium CG_4_9_14_3_um_filter_37_5]
MSGHSKWATTKRAKEAKDVKRSGAFTKLAKAISIAARDGADPNANFKLRMAIDRARKYSLPKDNIDRAIKTGSGGDGSTIMEELVYEAYGPAGSALIIEIITDNKNRTAGDVRHLIAKMGGNLATSGAVMWMFLRRGVIYLANVSISDDQELQLIDAGAVDISQESDGVVIYTEIVDLNKVRETAEQLGLTVNDSGLEYIAKDKVKIAEPEKIMNLMEALDDLDDVQEVYTNIEL